MPPREITFFAPGFRRYRTSEYDGQSRQEFVSISMTGKGCALRCEHCLTRALDAMIDLPASGKTLFDLAFGLALSGTRGILVSGGSDRRGMVPLMPHIGSLARVRRELDMTIHIHPGLPDERTCEAIATIDPGAVMMDVIGDERTIREIYHLDAAPAMYEAALANLERLGVPTVPHIVLGHYFGRMRGEWDALEMICRHAPKAVILVMCTPWEHRESDDAVLPDVSEISEFFHAAREALPGTPLMLGCARPLGALRTEIDRRAVAAGLDGVAYPSDGIARFARASNRMPRFVNGCCTVPW